MLLRHTRRMRLDVSGAYTVPHATTALKEKGDAPETSRARFAACGLIFATGFALSGGMMVVGMTNGLRGKASLQPATASTVETARSQALRVVVAPEPLAPPSASTPRMRTPPPPPPRAAPASRRPTSVAVSTVVPIPRVRPRRG